MSKNKNKRNTIKSYDIIGACIKNGKPVPIITDDNENKYKECAYDITVPKSSYGLKKANNMYKQQFNNMNKHQVDIYDRNIAAATYALFMCETKYTGVVYMVENLFDNNHYSYLFEDEFLRDRFREWIATDIMESDVDSVFVSPEEYKVAVEIE